MFAVREKIGAIATPDYIQDAPGLPKTRSGKVTRAEMISWSGGGGGLDEEPNPADVTALTCLELQLEARLLSV